MRLKYLTALLCCLSPFMWQGAFAQTEADALQPGKFSIKFSPQHLLFKGVHLDFEKSLSADSRHSIIFSPRFYAGNTLTIDKFTQRRWEQEDHGKVMGYGAEVLHRVYSSDISHEGVYFAYGLNYHHFDVEFLKDGWAQEWDEFGLEIYKYRTRPFHEEINRWGAAAMMGVQRPVGFSPILVDLYVGFGYTYSDIASDYSAVRYNMNAYDFGYSGVYVLGGFKVGVMF